MNNEDTLAFFDTLRKNALKSHTGRGFVYRPPRERAMPRIAGYVDFSKLNEISTACAVVLAAEYERMSAILSEVPPTIDLHKWNPSVFWKLFQIGFFEIVGLAVPFDSFSIDNDDFLTMKIVSANKADDLEKIDDGLQQLGYFLDPDSGLDNSIVIPFLTALSEAMTNVTNHAYPEDHEFEFRHIGRFWVAATADKKRNSLTVVIYDQGASIPVTYPRIRRTKKIQKYLSRVLRNRQEFDYENDGTYIRAALRYGGTRTNEDYRGKGFPQMLEILDRIGVGEVQVRSRGGWSKRATNGRITSGSYGLSIGGTLIEWTLAVPK